VRSDILVAFASGLPHQIKVYDTDAATAVSYHPRLLQLFRDLGDAGPSNAHHLGQKFLRQWKFRTNKIVHPQQPFTGPGSNIVNRIACRGLLDLR
jgi:hypothetical protein